MLLERLKGPIFFTHAKNWNRNVDVAKTEIAPLKPSLYKALIQKVVARLAELAVQRATSPTTAGAAKGERKNLTIFLSCSTKVSPELRQSAWHYLGEIIEHPDTSQEASVILSVDAEGIALADALVRDRAVALVRRNLQDKFACRAIRDMRSLLTQEEIREIVATFHDTFLTAGVKFNTQFEKAKEIGWPEVVRAVFVNLVENCASSTFDVANPAIKTVQQLPEDQAEAMPADVQVDYVLTIASMSGQFYPTIEAKKVTERGLGERKNYLDAVADAIGSDGGAFSNRSTDWEHLAHVCLASGRSDIVLELIRLVGEAQEQSTDRTSMLHYLKDVEDAQIAQAANNTISLIKARPSEFK